MATRKIKLRETAAVAPVNWKATDMLSTQLVQINTNDMRAAVAVNLLLLKFIGTTQGNMSLSKLRRSKRKIIGKTSFR